MSVAIPAKDERDCIGDALEAFSHQLDLGGRPLDPDLFEVVVFANDCVDDTADLVRAIASRRETAPAVHVFSDALPRDAAHVGSARRIALDVAWERQYARSGDAGIIASTDADSTVDAYWVARTLDELTRVDVVAGLVEIAHRERETMQAPLRLLYDRECTYRRLLGEVEARFDPRPFDPPSRHDSLVGASFAVDCRTYVAAGRLPVLPRLEDVAFARALRRIDARVRHATDIRVETSGRVLARVEGGFGSFIDDLRARGSRRESFLVDNADRSLARAKSRGVLRRYWADARDRETLDEAAELYGVSARTLATLVDARAPFGETLDRIDALAISFEALPDEPIEEAIAALREAANAPMPPAQTRVKAATGTR